MKKKDYETLARELRRRVALWSPADHTAGHLFNEVQERMSQSQQAASMAHYCAEHLAVDRIDFLTACGVKP